MRVGDTGRGPAACTVHAELRVRDRASRSAMDNPGALDQRPVTGQRAVRRLGLDGDDACGAKHHGAKHHGTEYHGGAHQAVFGYPEQDAAIRSAELGRDLSAGRFGENLRITGLPLSGVVVGTRRGSGIAAVPETAG